MADLVPEYAFEGDTIYALHEGAVIASGTDMESVESDATTYLEKAKQTFEVTEAAKKKAAATHIITPNGVKGTILARTSNMYGGTEISVRLANGTFATYQTHPEVEDRAQYVTEGTEKTASVNPTARLSSRLEADFGHDKTSLRDRAHELGEIAREAHRLITAGVPYSTQVELDGIRASAEVEARQVKEALDHLEAVDAEAFAPPAPSYQVVEQAPMGPSNDWLGETADQMIAESEAVDTEALLSEGPALLAADLETGTLVNPEYTRELALSHVVSKTAGFAGPEVEAFRNDFLARVETARLAELAERKATTKKEAAVEQEVESDAPDEALFM